jgi:NADPH:quinone reductase-like Zn-dependent oxidoreductase
MQRVRYHEYGGPEVLTVEDADMPTPGPGQVRLRVEAIGASYVDTLMRRGTAGVFARPLPGKLTGEVVGTVDSPGELLGKRVATLVGEDAFAEYVVADADWLIQTTLEPAAATLLPTPGPVALGVLRAGRLAPGETVLIHTGAGTIGGLAVQLAGLLGAGTVIVTASNQAKLDHARELGAHVGVDYTAADWPDQVRAAAPQGVDLVLDAVGGETLLASLELLAPLGRAVVYGAASGGFAEVPIPRLLRLRSLIGFSLLAWRAAAPEQARADIEEVASHFANGKLRADVHTRLPLAKAAEAHRLLEDRSTIGRILLLP